MPDLRADLYGKLWDNIGSRDARVWTFISFYGAVLALFFGSSITPEFRLLGLPIILVIAVWTIDLALSAEWWLVRNQMMVVRLELDDDSGLVGKVPSFYQYPGYRVDLPFTLFALSIIAIFVFTYASFLLTSIDGTVANAAASPSATAPNAINLQIQAMVSKLRPLLLIILHGVAIQAAAHILSRRESQIDECWTLAGHYQSQHLGTPTIKAVSTSGGELTDGRLRDGWAADRNLYSLRNRAILFIVLLYAVTIAPYFSASSTIGVKQLWATLAAYFGASIAYFIAGSQYRKWIPNAPLSIALQNLNASAKSGFWSKRLFSPPFQRIPLLMIAAGVMFQVLSWLGIVIADWPPALGYLHKFCSIVVPAWP
jgi:hypothetical protein